MFNMGQVFLFNVVLITHDALFYRERLCMLDEIARNLHILLRMKFFNGLNVYSMQAICFRKYKIITPKGDSKRI